MRVKLDENLGNRTLNIFREAGHDVQTTREVPGKSPLLCRVGRYKPGEHRQALQGMFPFRYTTSPPFFGSPMEP